ATETMIAMTKRSVHGRLKTFMRTSVVSVHRVSSSRRSNASRVLEVLRVLRVLRVQNVENFENRENRENLENLENLDLLFAVERDRIVVSIVATFQLVLHLASDPQHERPDARQRAMTLLRNA